MKFTYDKDKNQLSINASKHIVLVPNGETILDQSELNTPLPMDVEFKYWDFQSEDYYKAKVTKPYKIAILLIIWAIVFTIGTIYLTIYNPLNLSL